MRKLTAAAVVLLLGLLATLLATLLPPAAGLGQVATVAGTAAHEAFPGAVQLPDGRLWAVWREAGDHANPGGRLVARWSADGGDTWSQPAVAYAGATDARDPAATVLADGTLLVSFFTWNGLYGVGSDWRVWAMRSPDGGATWESPAQVRAGFPDGLEASSGPPLQLADGSVLQATYGWPDAADTHRTDTRISRSTDGGRTWQPHAPLTVGGREWSEPNLCQLADGRLVAFVRSDTPTQRIDVLRSADQGRTWAPAAALEGHYGRPACGHDLAGRLVLMYRDGTTGGYAETRWKASTDGGRTWSAAADFTGGQPYTYVYGQWVQLRLPDGRAAVGAVWAQQWSEQGADVYWRVLWTADTPTSSTEPATTTTTKRRGPKPRFHRELRRAG